jgi:transposase
VVVHRLLADPDVRMSVRTVERTVADLRRARRPAQLATVRVETPPGDQLQIDFGQKHVRIGDAWVRVFLLVAVLGYSRRLFVKPFSVSVGTIGARGSRRPLTTLAVCRARLLGDNARALVAGRERETGTVILQPAYLAFCRD